MMINDQFSGNQKNEIIIGRWWFQIFFCGFFLVGVVVLITFEDGGNPALLSVSNIFWSFHPEIS